MGIIGKSLLSAAALSMTIGGALPAMAAPSSHQSLASHNVIKAGSYDQSSSYRRGGDWGRHRDRDGVSTGDVLTGIGILAGIAIIASAASKSSRNDAPPPPPESYPDDNYNYDSVPRVNNDIGAAVEACSAAAENRAGGNARVEEIRSATRDGSGWRVEGSLSGSDAQGFTCGANGGAVDFIQLQS